jgi:hypothetical protein
MNGAESAYARTLAVKVAAGFIARADFEPERLRISHAKIAGGQSAWYTPDFRVVLPDGTVEFHEVKGRWEEAAKVRIRVAADQHPYRFVLVTARGGVRAGYTFDVSDVE